MSAKSTVQRHAAGAALAAKRGDMPMSHLKGAAKEMAKGMSEASLRHYATKPKKHQ